MNNFIKSVIIVLVLILLLVLFNIFFGNNAEINNNDQVNDNEITENNTNNTNMNDVNVQIQNEVEGNGEVAETGDTVAVHYVGRLEDGTLFDTSREDIAKEGGVYNEARPYEPFELQLGAGMVIAGWEQGLLGMKEGGKRTLVIPPELAYGERGAPGAIPPNATIVFDVELVSVTKAQN